MTAKEIIRDFEIKNKYTSLLNGSSLLHLLENDGHKAKIDLKEAKKTLGFDGELPMVLVIGGSQGARTINNSIQANLNHFSENNCQLLWQTGKTFTPDTQSKKGLQALPFISDMATAYAAADLVISRAGATSISELS